MVVIGFLLQILMSNQLQHPSKTTNIIKNGAGKGASQVMVKRRTFEKLEINVSLERQTFLEVALIKLIVASVDLGATTRTDPMAHAGFAMNICNLLSLFAL